MGSVCVNESDQEVDSARGLLGGAAGEIADLDFDQEIGFRLCLAFENVQDLVGQIAKLFAATAKPPAPAIYRNCVRVDRVVRLRSEFKLVSDAASSLDDLLALAPVGIAVRYPSDLCMKRAGPHTATIITGSRTLMQPKAARAVWVQSGRRAVRATP